MEEESLSKRKSCEAVGLSRSAYYRPVRDWASYDAEVIAALNEAVATNSRWGFGKCRGWLRNRGVPWNHKRLHRVYCQMGLNLPRRTRKRVLKRPKQSLEVRPAVNEMWSMDFMHDRLYCSKAFRTLNVLDEGVREALAIEIDTSLPAPRVVRVLEQLLRIGEAYLARFGLIMARNCSRSTW